MSTEAEQKKELTWKQKKELEEARKAGTAPAEVDEEGKDINPHIPQYISQAPWYVSNNRPSLKHQRVQEDKKKSFNTIADWYKKGVNEKARATKFRKGACTNCGAMTHKAKNCLDRPRKLGAKYTGQDIRPDEHLQPNLDFDYDGKRDRWNGYNPDWHQEIVDEYSRVEDAKRKLKAERLQDELISGTVAKPSSDHEDSSEDEDKYADEIDMPGTKFDSKRRTTVRNLRIREDTAKYLYNLDANGPYYDPKTRSMRGNPFGHMNKNPAEVPFAGENFVRHSGDVQDFAHQQMFAWEAYEHGTDVHTLADPTKLELMHKQFKEKKKNFKSDQQLSILEKYGGEEHLDAPPKELLLAQTENYIEYARSGTVIKGQERAPVKSKYLEDVYTNNHTSVWGSYWEAGQWGYACCHSMVKGSYCTGETGKLARKAHNPSSLMSLKESGDHDNQVKSLMEEHAEKQVKKSKKERREEERTKAEQEELAKQERLTKALAAMEKEEKSHVELDERKRSYHSMKADHGKAPTEEEMEAYYMKKRRTDDPMADFIK
ncbi:pre-mRNA-splicing factor SLU7-like [Dysidea avara]|uniref:pre-mRNA-splicing factor SLU7-like n=1 Tax=Dysidea avara TaxID=196820 RepID=UPI00332CF8B3